MKLVKMYGKDNVISKRQKDILRSVVISYMKSGEPVSSKELKSRHRFPYSTATLRNEMNALEKKGFLSHEHTSSGRVPTDKGYRNYVDELLNIQRVATHDIDRLSAEYNRKYDEINRLMFETSAILSTMSNYAGFAVTPRVNSMRLKRLEIIRLDNQNAALLLITESNSIKHRLLKMSFDFSSDELRTISEFLTNNLRGEKIVRIRERMDEVFRTVQQKYSRLLKCFDLSLDNFFQEDDIFLDGAAKVLKYSKSDAGCVEEIFEDKNRFSKIVERDMLAGLKIFIGDEIEAQPFRDFSIVRSTFSTPENQLGVIGIIGPKRMEYMKMADIVLSVSEALSKLFKKKEIGKNGEQ